MCRKQNIDERSTQELLRKHSKSMVNPMRTPLNSIDSIVGSLSTVPCVHMRAKMCHVFSSRNWAENRWSCSAGNFGRIQPWIHNPQSKGRRQFHLANCKTGPHWHTFTIIHHLTWAVSAQIFSVWLLNILGKSQARMQQTTCVCEMLCSFQSIGCLFGKQRIWSPARPSAMSDTSAEDRQIEQWKVRCWEDFSRGRLMTIS